MTKVVLDLGTLTTRQVLDIESQSGISVDDWKDNKGHVVVAALIAVGGMDEDAVMAMPFADALASVDFAPVNPTQTSGDDS